MRNTATHKVRSNCYVSWSILDSDIILGMTENDLDNFIEWLDNISLQTERDEIKFRAELKEMGREDILDKPIYARLFFCDEFGNPIDQ